MKPVTSVDIFVIEANLRKFGEGKRRGTARHGEKPGPAAWLAKVVLIATI